MAEDNKGHKDEFTIYVNGTPEVWEHKKVTYEQVVKIAFPNGPHGDNVRYNVSWTTPDGREGSLRHGESVDVINKMTFDVRNTDKS